MLPEPSGSLTNESEIGSVVVGFGENQTPVYLRELGELFRGYQTPPRLLNYFSWRDDACRWQRSRTLSLAAQMRDGEQIGIFGAQVGTALDAPQQRLPKDLRLERVSDQPRQVAENIDLFMVALYEVVALVFQFRNAVKPFVTSLLVPVIYAIFVLDL